MTRQNIMPYEPVGRLIEDAGAERVSQEAKVAMGDYLEDYAVRLGKQAVRFAQHAGRTTLLRSDIQLALKNMDD